MKQLRRALLLGALLVPALALAKRPEPMPCPTDMDAAMAAACPCAGPGQGSESAMSWKNHGQYVRCMVKLRNALRRSGCLTDETRRTVASCAAQSSCGRRNADPTCCVATPDTCANDPDPNDGLAGGTCTGSPTMACNSDVDCPMMVSEQSCSLGAGTPAAGTVCNPCVTPAP